MFCFLERHIRYVQLLYLWTCIASDLRREIIVERVVKTMFCFLERWLECCVRNNCSLVRRLVLSVAGG